jgi:hypothetical protein
MKNLLRFCVAVLLICFCLESAKAGASFNEMIASKRDVWGEEAIRQPNGPSYEFFEALLPPQRYVNADFRYYPIVLSAPNAPVKARLISNGSGINLRAGDRSWKDFGTPALFRVGPDEFQFGGELQRLEQPTLVEGYLPIVQIRYYHPMPLAAESTIPVAQVKSEPTPETYQLEAFASTDPALADHGVVFVKFSLARGTNGVITVAFDSKSPLKFTDGVIRGDDSTVIAEADNSWRWTGNSAQARLTSDHAAVIAIATKPLTNTFSRDYENQRAQCVAAWKDILAGGMNLETPEAVVNNAWRHLIIQNFELINGDAINYSAGNQYEALYEAEGSDAALAMLAWGYEKDFRRLMVPLYEMTKPGLEFHQAGFKLLDLCRYYWQTRDRSVVGQMRSWTTGKNRERGWEPEARRLDTNRTGAHGLYPLERYCSDIHTPVQTINANAKGWRAMRDLSVVLAENGVGKEAKHYAEVAAEFRPVVLQAIEESARHETVPPFIPVALYSNEPPHDPIAETRIGCYWNIIVGYTIASGIFPPGTGQETWLPHYQEQHAGLCMGMLRAGGLANTFWNSGDRLDPLYGTRYALDTLRRDDVDRALVSFYGMLAQGFTRNTFVGGEGACLVPLDEGGRFFYCPPNSAANGHLLSMLRNLLVQDFDLNDDGKPDTLRLCFATPKHWLEDGKTIKLEHAPTAFGRVSLKMESHLSEGFVLAEVELPERNAPEKTLLRARVPDGWTVRSALVGSKKLAVDGAGTVDLTAFKGKQTVRFAVAR